jgi:hypothetical protein
MIPLIIGGVICAFVLTSLAIMWWVVVTAPFGYQTDDGWHAGEPDEHADNDNLGI